MKKSFVRRTAVVIAAVMFVMSVLSGCSGSQDSGSSGTESTVTNSSENSSESASSAESSGTPESSSSDSPAAGADSAKESPMLAEEVASGSLPAVEDRLPDTPKVLNELDSENLTLEDGQYGGTMRTVSLDTTTVGTILTVGCMEPLINSPSFAGKEFVPNVVESFEVNDDYSEFTFTLRKGLKWSDGEPVTMDDVTFGINDVMMNEEITSTVPNMYRTGGAASGNPMTLEVVDDWTFKLKFDGSYYGFLIKISMQGWPSYQDIIKPAHYLKNYHKDYLSAENFQKLLSDNNTDESEWGVLFNEYDITNWEIGSPNSIGFPMLTPWIVETVSDTKTTMVRNPYYFKVDELGRQMPYIDKAETYYVSDKEVQDNMIIAGQIDFANGDMSKMSIYKENETNGYHTIVADYHGRLGNIYYNFNYDDENWKGAIQDIRFRQALSLATNRQEILDTIFYGLGSLPDTDGYADYDPDKANQLLDEMGLDQRDANGWRTYADGTPVSIVFTANDRTPENEPVTEMLVTQLQEIGINATFKSVDTSLFSEQRSANQVQAFVERMETYWWMGDAKFIYWCPLWESYYSSNGETGEEPPEEVTELMQYATDCTGLPMDEAPQAFEKLEAGVKEYYGYIPIMQLSQVPLIVNSNLGNVDYTGSITSIILNFSLEETYFKQ